MVKTYCDLGHDLCGALFLPCNREDYHRMTEDFIREVEKHCKWIAEEMRNFRHSDEARISYCICYAIELLEMLEKKEEEIESIN
jgi:hypothetical protein